MCIFYCHQSHLIKSNHQVFCRGLSVIKNEEDLHFLDQKHKQFQARVMKKMIETDPDDILQQVKSLFARMIDFFI